MESYKELLRRFEERWNNASQIPDDESRNAAFGECDSLLAEIKAHRDCPKWEVFDPVEDAKNEILAAWLVNKWPRIVGQWCDDGFPMENVPPFRDLQFEQLVRKLRFQTKRRYPRTPSHDDPPTTGSETLVDYHGKPFELAARGLQQEGPIAAKDMGPSNGPLTIPMHGAGEKPVSIALLEGADNRLDRIAKLPPCHRLALLAFEYAAKKLEWKSERPTYATAWNYLKEYGIEGAGRLDDYTVPMCDTFEDYVSKAFVGIGEGRLPRRQTGKRQGRAGKPIE